MAVTKPTVLGAALLFFAIGIPRVDAVNSVASGAPPASVGQQNWVALGGGWKGQFYSQLSQIDAANVRSLGMAWQFNAMPSRGGIPRGLEATPIVDHGVLYASLAWSEVVALSAATGRQIWRYDPHVAGGADRNSCCDVVNRGVAVGGGQVFVGTTDGYLVALNAHTGKVAWRVDTIVDRNRPYVITGAPQIAGHVVVIGNSGAEFGVRGYVSAYDLRTGVLRWRFFTVPGNPHHPNSQPEMRWATRTWNPRSQYWKTGGGGTVWGNMAYDPKLDLLYFGTGNGTPYPTWFRSPGNSKNLFLASILALDPDTGRLKWYYQETPGEMWDYDATEPLVLATVKINGRARKVVMQASKNGFFYVLDRTNGQLISAGKFVHVNWASHVSLTTGLPVLTGEGWYKNAPKLVYPGEAGGHNWMPMSYSPKTGLVYIPAIDTPMLFSAAPNYRYHPGEFNMAAGASFPPIPTKFRIANYPAKIRERLIAWDPITQREKWRVPLPGFFNGGVLSTAGGLVFQGTSSGHLIAYDANTGRTLKDIDVGTGIMAAPATYSINGVQYVVVLVGYGGAMQKMFVDGVAARTYQNQPRIIAFRLNGRPVPMPPTVVVKALPHKPYVINASMETIRRGKSLYLVNCARCHGGFWRGVPSGYPNLERMPAGLYQNFEKIVLDGALHSEGMVSFSDVLDRRDALAIEAYLKTRANELITSKRAHPIGSSTSSVPE